MLDLAHPNELALLSSSTETLSPSKPLSTGGGGGGAPLSFGGTKFNP